jgi:Spy/CpxP family protein refolding chaperone
MTRQLGWALAALIACGAASSVATAASQSDADQNKPPVQEVKRDDRGGRWAWWKDKDAIREIGITREQSAEIDRIFHTEIDLAKPLREEVMRLEKALSATIKANTAEVAVVEQQVEKVERKRAELNKRRVVMLYRIHRVLTLEQNARFQAMVDRWEASRKKQGGDRRH